MVYCNPSLICLLAGESEYKKGGDDLLQEYISIYLNALVLWLSRLKEHAPPKLLYWPLINYQSYQIIIKILLNPMKNKSEKQRISTLKQNCCFKTSQAERKKSAIR